MDGAAAAIELPGEALPLDGSTLQQNLIIATRGNNPQDIQIATKQLETWQTKPGYYGLLQDVFVNQSLPREIRMLSLIQLKNGIDRYWRKSAANAIAPAERTKVRSRLLKSTMLERDEQLVTLSSIVTAKIARFDFPGQWPDLFNEIIQLLEYAMIPQASPSELNRGLSITLQLIKELSTVRLQRSRASLLTVAPKLFTILQQIYFTKAQQFEKFLSIENSASLEAQEHLKATAKCLKIIRRLAVAGFEFPHRSDEVKEFWAETPLHVKSFLSLIRSTNLEPATKQILISILMQLTKLHLTMAQDHPYSFGLIPDSAKLAREYWNMAKDIRGEQLGNSEHWRSVGDLYDKFNLNSLLLQRACIKTVTQHSLPFKFKSGSVSHEPQQAREYLRTNLLTEEYAKDVFQNLISRFLVYLEGEIEEWTNESEDWEAKVEENEDAYDRSVRPCAERLLLDLARNYKETLTEDALALVANVSHQDGTVVFKDAVYSAIGVAAPLLQGKFDFDLFLTRDLTKELQKSGTNQTIMRRRIAVLLSQWISIGVSEENRPLVYEIYQHLLDKNVPANDLAVRITAGKRLCEVVDDFGFKPEPFYPYASSILAEIVQLIQDVDLVENKMAIIRTLAAIVERMEVNVAPFADQIISLLPPLWTESSKENIMKQEVVTLLTRLIEAMKTDSTPAHALVVPIIEAAVDPDSESQIYLLDDALDLWTAVMYCAKDPASAEILSLAPKVFHLLEMENKIIEKALDIEEMYILLAPSVMLEETARHQIIESATSLLQVQQHHLISQNIENIEVLIRAADSVGGESAVTAVVGDLIEYGFLGKVLDSIHLNWEASQTTGPNKKDPPKDWKNETDYLGLLARILVCSGRAFLLLIRTWAEDHGSTFEATIGEVLDEWFSNMDAAIDPDMEKLYALALTKLLETREPWIFSRLQELMDLWTSLIVELRDGEEDTSSDCLVYAEEMPKPGPHEPAQEVRKRRVLYSDPVHTTNLGQYVKAQLSGAITACGGDEMFRQEWLVNVDEAVIKAFGELGL